MQSLSPFNYIMLVPNASSLFSGFPAVLIVELRLFGTSNTWRAIFWVEGVWREARNQPTTQQLKVCPWALAHICYVPRPDPGVSHHCLWLNLLGVWFFHVRGYWWGLYENVSQTSPCQKLCPETSEMRSWGFFLHFGSRFSSDCLLWGLVLFRGCFLSQDSLSEYFHIPCLVSI